jgi:hypothetical protein
VVPPEPVPSVDASKPFHALSSVKLIVVSNWIMKEFVAPAK